MDAGLLPSIERYISERIKYVNSRAEKENAAFLILSGKFGLLKPADRIEYYDKLLAVNEVSALSDCAAEYLKNNNAEKVLFFHYSIDKDPNIRQYYNTVKYACGKAGILFESIEIDIE